MIGERAKSLQERRQSQIALLESTYGEKCRVQDEIKAEYPDLEFPESGLALDEDLEAARELAEAKSAMQEAEQAREASRKSRSKSGLMDTTTLCDFKWLNMDIVAFEPRVCDALQTWFSIISREDDKSAYKAALESCYEQVSGSRGSVTLVEVPGLAVNLFTSMAPAQVQDLCVPKAPEFTPAARARFVTLAALAALKRRRDEMADKEQQANRELHFSDIQHVCSATGAIAIMSLQSLQQK